MMTMENVIQNELILIVQVIIKFRITERFDVKKIKN